MKKVFFLLGLFFSFTSVADASLLVPEKYPGTSTYLCRTDPMIVYPGQNLNLLRFTETCPRAKKLEGSGPEAPEEGYITRWKPDMVEILSAGKTKTPRVDDLHLHHAVLLKNMSRPFFAVGEEKTIVSLPYGYGFPITQRERWGLNYMIHSLRATSGRKVELRWTIDFVERDKTYLRSADMAWLDVAGSPQIYPVFDAERKFDLDRDGRFVFPDDAWDVGHEENKKISERRRWIIGEKVTLIWTAGHLHPGGLWNDLYVKRGAQSKHLFRSRAHFFGPTSAVSWDIAMQATPREWAVHLLPGDEVYTSATYNVKRASWYEAMGIMPLAFARGHQIEGKDPFQGEIKKEGLLTHGRLQENIDLVAGKKIGLKNPAKLKPRKGSISQISIKGFWARPGGYSAIRGFPERQMRPPRVKTPLLFYNADSLLSQSQENQVWHTVTSCKMPCNRDSGISYPLADGRFDSGQLGFGIDDPLRAIREEYGYYNSGVTTGSSRWSTPKLRPGSYAYFCRIHPFMRGSFKVKK